MAEYIFNVAESAFNVIQLDPVETDCATIYTWQITAVAGNSIRFNIGQVYQFYDNAFYTELGVETPFDHTADVTVTYGTDLYVSFSLGNSGTPGLFHKCKLQVWDDTTADPYSFFFEIVSRANDNLPCDDPTGQGGTYDELTDTPDNKVGHALKLVRVNAGETDHEYVDPGTLGNDLNHTHVFTSTTSVVIPHNLGKIPSVTIVDGSDNIIYGDITYTDLNNLTITFNTAFAGTVYLN